MCPSGLVKIRELAFLANRPVRRPPCRALGVVCPGDAINPWIDAEFIRMTDDIHVEMVEDDAAINSGFMHSLEKHHSRLSEIHCYR
jgi:hypothetical protein